MRSNNYSLLIMVNAVLNITGEKYTATCTRTYNRSVQQCNEITGEATSNCFPSFYSHGPGVADTSNMSRRFDNQYERPKDRQFTQYSLSCQ